MCPPPFKGQALATHPWPFNVTQLFLSAGVLWPAIAHLLVARKQVHGHAHFAIQWPISGHSTMVTQWPRN
eukprot:4665624-Lingulodinium_polyedra.AAC.1